jgi:hypothetical protein
MIRLAVRHGDPMLSKDISLDTVHLLANLYKIPPETLICEYIMPEEYGLLENCSY